MLSTSRIETECENVGAVIFFGHQRLILTFYHGSMNCCEQIKRLLARNVKDRVIFSFTDGACRPDGL